MIDHPVEEPLIRIDSEVTRRVRQHARAHMQTEVCGVLVGKMCEGIIKIEAPIEAFTAAQSGAHVTFTQAAWETIYRVKDKDYPQDRIVGWYHSHPGFGVFLSDYDTFIHRNFFSSPDQVAWVYDPHSDEEGCFGWVDGAIHRIANIHVADNSGEGLQRASQPAVGGHRLPARPAAQQPSETRIESRVETRMETRMETRVKPRAEASPRLPSRVRQNHLRLPATIGAAVRNTSVVCRHLARRLVLSIWPASQRLLRMCRLLAVWGRAGIRKAPQPPLESQGNEAIEQLGSEGGK